MMQGLSNLVAPLLQEAGIGMPAGPIDDEAFIRLYRRGADLLSERTAKDDGRKAATVRDHVMQCRCMLSCGTLEEAIRCAGEFCELLYPRLGVLTLEVEDKSAKLLIDSLRRNPNRGSCLVDVSDLLGLVQSLNWLIGENLPLRSVALGYPNRSDVEPLLDLFGVPVSAGAKLHCLEFDSQLLARPIIRRPEELQAFISTYPYDLVGHNAHSLPLGLRVRVYMDAALAKGKPMPGLKELAALIGGSERTLRKRLEQEGTSYSALRELSRRQVAEHYLAHTSLTVDQIVERLGFYDCLSFRRAFRRWTGSTPTQYRAFATDPNR